MIIMGKQYITKRKYYYLYQITNLLNHKIYIGVHATDNINDGYMGSGSLITLVLSGEYVGITAGCKQTKESNRKRSETQRGKSKPQKYFECPVCHTITVKGNLIRWHKHCKEQFEKEHNNERYNLNLKEISRS